MLTVPGASAIPGMGSPCSTGHSLRPLAPEAALLEALASLPRHASHGQWSARRGSPKGTPGCSSPPLAWRWRGRLLLEGGGGRGPRALARSLAVLGARRGTAHLLVPGAWPCGVHGLRAGMAQPRAAQGQQCQSPAPGRAGPEPRPHSARCERAPPAGSGARLVEVGAARLRLDGARPEKAGGSGAPRPPRSAAAPSGFSLPVLLFHPVRPRYSLVPQ